MNNHFCCSARLCPTLVEGSKIEHLRNQSPFSTLVKQLSCCWLVCRRQLEDALQPVAAVNYPR